MKKRLILINLSVLFISLLVVLIASSVSFLNVFTRNSEEMIEHYLNMSCAIYENNNEDDVIEIARDTNPSLRVTIIDLSGNVIADSNSSDIEDNHLERDEIKNPGKIVERYSKTVNRKMIYLAKKLLPLFLQD